MAYLISSTTGNFTAAGTWGLVDTTAGVSVDSEAANTAIGTSYVESQAFTPGAITIDGIAVKIASRVASPTGTASIRVAQAGATVAGTEVTIDVADIPTASSQGEGGWVFFKFAAPVLLAAATAYTISAKGSIGSEYNLYRDGTAGNWSRLIRTTTTQAPAAGDTLIICGDHTGSGTGNDIVVTMDETATTDYGTGTDGSRGLEICKRGTLSYGTTAATNYYLKYSGNIIVYNGGVFNIGTTGTPIPRDSTAVLEFDPVADGGMGLIVRNGGTFNSQGLSRTSGKNIYVCKLNTFEASGQTTLGVDTDTGWLNGDNILIAKTERSASGLTELKVLNGNAGASTIDITSGLSNNHSGSSPTQAHVGLLSRNVKIRSATSTLMTYLNFKATSIVDIDWTEIYYIGERAVGKQGIEVETTTGSFNMQYCSVWASENRGFITVGSATDNITVSNNIWYSLNSDKTANDPAFDIAVTSGTSIIVTYNYFFRCGASGGSATVVNLADVGITFSHNVVIDTNSGCSIFLNQSGTIGEFDDNEVYGGDANPGIQIQTSGLTGIMSNCKIWFINSSGILFNAAPANLTINDLLIFGNNTQNVYNLNGKMTWNDCQFSSYSGTTTTNNINIVSSSNFPTATFNDCSFGPVTGSYIAATTDMRVQGTLGGTVLFNNCLFTGTNLVALYSNLLYGGTIRFNKHNQTANKHIWYTTYGIAQSTGTGLTDTTVRTSGSLGLRIAPENSSTGFSWSFKILAKASTYVGVAGFIKKNAAFGTDVCTVSLFLPGSTVADATQTMGNDTNWNVFNLAASYTGTEDLYATVTINAKTATAAAYIYVDDIYNGTNKITALDVWDEGQPSPIMYEQLGDAAAVWAVLQSTQTTSGTMGNRLAKALTLPLFIGLK